MKKQMAVSELITYHNDLATYEPGKISPIQSITELQPHQYLQYQKDYNLVSDDGESFHFFWNGPFSQWFSSEFKINNIRFNCAEQAMMYGKAIVFKDYKTADLVMQTNEPSVQKKLGRGVVGFNVDQWESICKDIVFIANFAKFTQNPELLKFILSTGVDTLVEASPYDQVWGIGLAQADPRCMIRSLWKGKNYLGEVLMEVRECISDGNYILLSAHEENVTNIFDLFV